MLRLIAVPFFVYFYLKSNEAHDRSYDIAVVLFFVAAFTDLFDGYIARKAGVMSQFGKMIDPLADRLLVGSAAILLSVDGPLPGWAFLVVVWRDILAVCGFVLVRRQILPDVNRMGKWGTAMMMAAIAWLLVFPDSGGYSDALIALFWAGVGVSAVALVEYWVRYSSLVTGRGGVESEAPEAPAADVYSGSQQTTPPVGEESSGPAT